MELPPDPRKALAAVNANLREIVANAHEKGLDETMERLEELAVSVWAIEPVLRDKTGAVPPPINRFAEVFQSALHRLAPPPPKKIKRDTPPRKILPLSEAGAVRALDTIMLIRALVEVGDFTRQTDKARASHLLFLDDWRRMAWESARLPSWDRVRELLAGEPPWAPRVPEIRFSRRSAITLLEAMGRYRDDHITPIPAVSMIACQRCGRHEGRERQRCTACSRLVCGKCQARTANTCLTCYAERYRPLPPESRAEILNVARDLCKRFRLDEFVRNAAFQRALHDHGVDVIFDEHAPDNGEETTDRQGRVKLRVKDRENATTKKILFASLGRAIFRAAEREPAELESAFFLDLCMGVALDEPGAPAPAPAPAPDANKVS